MAAAAVVAVVLRGSCHELSPAAGGGGGGGRVLLLLGRALLLSLPTAPRALHLPVAVTDPVRGLAVVSVAGCINFVLPCFKTSAVQEQD